MNYSTCQSIVRNASYDIQKSYSAKVSSLRKTSEPTGKEYFIALLDTVTLLFDRSDIQYDEFSSKKDSFLDVS